MNLSLIPSSLSFLLFLSLRSQHMIVLMHLISDILRCILELMIVYPFTFEPVEISFFLVAGIIKLANPSKYLDNRG